MAKKFKVTGLKELREQLTQLGAIAGQRILASAARTAMKPVLDDARVRVPVASGLLHDALRLATVRPTSGNVVASAGVAIAKKVNQEIPVVLDEDEEEPVSDLTTTARVDGPRHRWHFVEFGTVNMAAQPFLRPAFDARKGEALDRFKKFLRKKIEKARKRQLTGKGA